MAKRIEASDPYVTPTPRRDKGGFIVRTSVIALILAALAFTGYLMTSAEDQSRQLAFLEQQAATLAPGYTAPSATPAHATTAAPEASSRVATPPPQKMPAEPASTSTPPALPPAADPDVAIPEIQ